MPTIVIPGAVSSVTIAGGGSGSILPPSSGSGSGTTGEVVLTAISVTPTSPSLTPPATQQMVATGIYSDASTQDITFSVTWSTSDGTKATVSIGGLVTSVASGSATIFATLGAISGNTVVTVNAPSSVPVVTSYSPNNGQVGDSITIIGSLFTGATSVHFNGASASFIVIGDSSISAIVPNSTTGTVSVTTPGGTGTGPSFTINANNFAFSLTTPSVPSGVTVTRTGSTVYEQRSATTVQSNSGSAIFEDFGDGNGGGIWTFAGYLNPAPPFDLSDALWDKVNTPTITTNDAIAPDGTLTADKLADLSAGESRYIGVAGTDTPGSNVLSFASVWAKPASPTPSAPGAIGAVWSAGVTPYAGFQFVPAETGWKRYTSVWTKVGGQPTSTEYVALIPCGATPAAPGDITITLDPAATGAMHFWGAQGARSFGSVPLVDGSTSNAVISADTPANAIAANGDLHIEGAFLEDLNYTAFPGDVEAFAFYEMQTPGGVFGLYAGQQTTVNGYFRGVSPGASGASVNVGQLDQGAEFRWETWYRPSIGDFGMQFWIGGSRQTSVRAVGGGAISFGTPTVFNLGHSAGTKVFPARHTLLRKTSRSIDAADGVILGDSIISAYTGVPAVGTLIYTITESRSRNGIVSYAFPGQTIAQQATSWSTAPQRGDSNVNFVIIHAGINSLASGGLSAAAATTELQNLINDINTQNPNAKIIVNPIFPCLGNVGGVVWAKALTFNDNIAGIGPNPIIGLNLIITPYWSNADAGNHGGSAGALWSSYDLGDGIHENTLGRRYMAGILRAELVAAGIL